MRLFKNVFLFMVIVFIFYAVTNNTTAEEERANQDFSIAYVVNDFKDRVSNIDFVEMKDNVVSGWNNLMFLVSYFTNNDAVPAIAPVDTDVELSSDPEDFETHEFEMRVLELVNIERENHHLPPLEYSKEVSVVARAKSHDMAVNRYFAHESPTYGSPFDMMNQFGVQYWSAGENIAMGQRTPEQVMDGWMNSEGHRANILQESFTHLGVGFVKANGTYYWTQMFVGR